MSSEMDDGPAGEKLSRHRSPNYPAVGLREAINRATLLYRAAGTAGALPDGAARVIGYNKAHGTAKATLSALKKFGLIEEKSGKLTPTQLTVDLSNFAADSERHRKAISEAVLKPVIYKEILDHYQPHGVLPSNDVLRGELVADRGFHPDKVNGFLDDLRDSLQMAGLLAGNQLASGDERPDATLGGGGSPKKPLPGDWVQWVSGGIDQFKIPVQVLGTSDDGEWAFVKGTTTGLPMSELTLVDPPIPSRQPPLNPYAGRDEERGTGDTAKEQFTLDEGAVVLFRPGELSKASVLDLEAWLDVVIGRMKRKVGMTKEQPTGDKDEPATGD